MSTWSDALRVMEKEFLKDQVLLLYGYLTQAAEGLGSENLKELALKRYQNLTGASSSTDCVERLMSGSDDFTLFLWSPEKESKPIARLTGHMQLVNDVKFSPGSRLIIS